MQEPNNQDWRQINDLDALISEWRQNLEELTEETEELRNGVLRLVHQRDQDAGERAQIAEELADFHRRADALLDSYRKDDATEGP